MAPKYELMYFPIRGLGFMIRILLADQEIEHKFSPVERESWPELKPTTPFGQLPVLILDGKTKLSQSLSIVRYLGREHGLMGSNNLEAAQIEMLIDQSADFRRKLLTMLFQNYENGLKPFVESIPTELEPFEKHLAASGDKEHLLLGKVTAADYIVFDLLLALDALSPGCLSKTPSVQAYFRSFGAREKLREFLERPEIKTMRYTFLPHL